MRAPESMHSENRAKLFTRTAVAHTFCPFPLQFSPRKHCTHMPFSQRSAVKQCFGVPCHGPVPNVVCLPVGVQLSQEDFATNRHEIQINPHNSVCSIAAFAHAVSAVTPAVFRVVLVYRDGMLFQH